MVLNLLLVGIPAGDVNALLSELGEAEYQVHHMEVDSLPLFRSFLQKEPWDIIIGMDSSGVDVREALTVLREGGQDIPFLLISGTFDGMAAVSAVRAGAAGVLPRNAYALLLPLIERESAARANRLAAREEKHKNEAEIAGLQQHISTMIQQNPQPILLMDLDLHIRVANEAFCRLSGYLETDALKMSAREFRIWYKKGGMLREALETRKGVTGEIGVEFPHGRLELEQHTIPLLDGEGNIVSIMAVYNDLTEKKARERESSRQMEDILALQHRTEVMIRDNPLGIVVLDNTKKRLDMNREYERIWNGTREDLLPKTMKDFEFEILSGDDIYSSFVTEKPGQTKILVTLPGGIRKYLSLSQVPILMEAGGIDVVYYIYQDLTAEEALSRYWACEVERITKNLMKLGQGDLGFDLEIAQGDRYTEKAHEDFVQVKNALIRVTGSMETLIGHVSLFVEEAGRGNLSFRGDKDLLQGEYSRIVEGLNDTLDRIEQPLKETMKIAGRFAGGDFSARFSRDVTVQGDFGDLKESLDKIGVEISAALTTVSQQILVLASGAEEANANIEEVSAGAQEIAVNTSRVGDHAEQCGEGIRQVLLATEDLSRAVQDVASKTRVVVRLAEDADQLSRKGGLSARKAEAGMDEITRHTLKVDAIVKDIKSQMDQIGKIVGVISDIAGQTNLLALNAAIEAARAGESGRGFAVVASEVKSLAQESRSSAGRIAGLIRALEEKTLEATRAMEETDKTVREGAGALRETLAVFDQIASAIGDISKNVGDVASATEEQETSTLDITSRVGDVAGLVQGTAKDAVNAATAAGEASVAVDQIRRIIGKVHTIVEQVSREMNRFRI